MKEMFEPYYPNKVIAWPVGIDTEKWKPSNEEKEFDFLIYNKIRWDEDEMNDTLISPIMKILKENSFKVTTINYGAYKHEELIEKLLANYVLQNKVEVTEKPVKKFKK